MSLKPLWVFFVVIVLGGVCLGFLRGGGDLKMPKRYGTFPRNVPREVALGNR